jgi:SecD/SecF fusion protein
MVYFSRWKIIAVIAVCVLGVLIAAPNLIGRDTLAKLPGWVPTRQVNLGLDLRGGSYLLLQIDLSALDKERLDNVLDSARAELRTAKIPFTSADIEGGAVHIVLRDPSQTKEATAALNKMDSGPAGTASTYEIASAGPGDIKVGMTEEALRARRGLALEQSVEIVRRRVDSTGVAEPQISQQDPDRILVELPGVKDPDEIKKLIGTTAKMDFHLVDETAEPDPAHVPAGDMLLQDESMKGRGGQSAPILVKRRVDVSGGNLIDASVGQDSQNGGYVVKFEFDSAGARKMAQLTQQNIGHRFAVVLDDKVITAPVIRGAITGGSGEITGNFTAQDASDLALLLRAGALPAPIKIIEERSVGPDLGADSIKAGMYATALGLALVLGYMLVSYGLFGLFADVAVILNLVLTVAALSLLQATLTLPGIAGLLLSVGMSVDANILINERIREETKNGKSPFAAMEAGFSKAWSTIIDSNLTTLIKMAILYVFGAGAVRGFAVTIFLGILISMFTATILVRLMMTSWLRKVRPKQLKISLLRFVPDKTHIRFMKGRFFGIGLSATLSIASIALFFAPGLNYGIDFAGGIQIELKTQGPADFPALRGELDKLGLGAVKLQQFGAPDQVLIRLDRQPGGDDAQQAAVAKVKDDLARTMPAAQIQSTAAVGATISGELFWDGMKALGFALIAMLAYIWFRFEWQFGVGAVLTLILDVTKTIGFFVVTGAVFGWQFDLESIAAILAIMGYSINDKVVVYDRVRENLRKYRTMPLRELIDLSINETLSRTIGTSTSVFLATIPLALIGGQALLPFAAVMLFGIILSTTSSIWIAAPILLFLGENRLRRNAVTPPRAAAKQPEPAAAR